jgi:hypothetical protein
MNFSIKILLTTFNLVAITIKLTSCVTPVTVGSYYNMTSLVIPSAAFQTSYVTSSALTYDSLHECFAACNQNNNCWMVIVDTSTTTCTFMKQSANECQLVASTTMSSYYKYNANVASSTCPANTFSDGFSCR